MAIATTHVLSVPLPFGNGGASIDVYSCVLSDSATSGTVNVGKRVVFAAAIERADATPGAADFYTTVGNVAVTGITQDGTFDLLTLSLGN